MIGRTFFFYICFTASIASFQFGYNLSTFNSASELLKDQYYVIVIVPISAVFGCYICCWFSLIFGRVQTFHFINLLYLLGNLLSFILLCKLDDEYNSFELLINITFAVGRVFAGLAVGGSSYIVPLYSNLYTVREIAPIEIYAKLGSINQFMITFGILLSYILGFLLEGKILVLWLFGLSIVVIFIHTILLLTYFNIESPTFLLKENKTQTAMKIMSRLYYNQELEDSEDCFDSEIQLEQDTIGFKDLFLSLKNNKTLRMGCILAALQQLTGINFLIVTSSSIFPKEKDLFTLILGIVNCITGSSSIFLLKKHYKTNLFAGALGMSLCYILIIILSILSLKSESNPINYSYIGICFCFVACFEFSIGPILWIYCADILCERGIAITSSINWICASLIIGAFDVIAESYSGGIYKNKKFFIPLNCFSLFFCLCIAYYARFRMKERSELQEHESIHSIKN